MIAPLTLAALSTAAGTLDPQGPPPAPVRVDPVRREAVQERRGVTGEVRPRRRAAVAPREAGLVLELLVRPGEAVAAGGLIARLDASRIELSLETMAQALASAAVLLEQRQEEAAQADRDLEVARELATKKTVGQKQLIDATSAAKVAHIRARQAEVNLEGLRAQRAELELRLADMRIHAPFGGVVVTRSSEVGEWVEVGSPLVELVSVDELEIWLDVPQRYASALAGPHDPIEVAVEAVGLELSIAKGRFVPEVDSAARTFKYVLDVTPELMRPRSADGPVPPLATGMSVVARVPTGAPEEHWTVAPSALLRGPVGSYLFVARASDGAGPGDPLRAERVPVELLFTTGGRAVVRSGGLRRGDRAVIEGNERLSPGAPVVPTAEPGDGNGR